MSTLHQPAVPTLTLGWRIQLALDHAGLKYLDLMDRFEVSRGTVSRWCRDVGPRPKRFVLEEIAVMCGIEIDWLLGDQADPPSKDPSRFQQTHSRRLFSHPMNKPDGLYSNTIRRPAPLTSVNTAA
jgi:transcriptional regulator with XRE-family HTH domain